MQIRQLLLFFTLLLSALRPAFAQVDSAPLYGPYKLEPLSIQATDCESIAIDDSHLNRDMRLRIWAFSPDEITIFKNRRRIILEEIAKQLRNHIDKLGWLEQKRQCFFKNESRALKFAKDATVEITKVIVGGDAINYERTLPTVESGLTQHDLGILVFKDMLEAVDYKIIENARDIIECQKFGFCTGLGLKTGIGFRRAFVGFGGFLSRDTVRSFEKNAKWSTHYTIDIEVGTRAITPTVSLFFGLRAFLHFDKAPHAEITDFKTTYFMGFPIAVKGPKTAGIGGTLGFAGIPLISHFAWFESQMIRIKPTRQGLKQGCEAILSVFKDKFKPIKISDDEPERVFLPDDVQ